MSRQNTLCLNWDFLLVGLLFIIMQCDARAVNVSNTWTMPQEGLNVFYRFFRDRISWFEADAVCQFHHANLVTVDNSFQFDATRDLLRELDVNDIVWIGLMRPQSSDRFMWSNSRPLVADTGYWAESLPLMDAPLCAVIDPIRDYRWHALRCGGPETASFLCEMPVPSWADACNLKDMPNLTLQYMADTASIELIRNCQEEGLLRTMCRGKQDRERALHDLICPRERLEAQRINDITNSHFKSLQIINSIPSDNNENNDIELLPMEVNYGSHYPEELQTEKNTVQRLIEQFNVDELMQADEPSNMETVSSFYKISGLIPKPVKKSTKKVLEYPKKEINKPKIIVEPLQKDKKRLPLEMEDVMMGDQPLQGEPELPEQILNEDVSNEILEPLPHIKKTNLHKEDGLEKIEKEAAAIKKSMQLTKEIEMKKILMMVTNTNTEPSTTTTSSSLISISTTNMPVTTAPAVITHKFAEETSTSEDQMKKSNADNSGGHLITTTPSATIEHPIHPQQLHNNFGGEEIQHSYTKESADSSHFIPPMLMVKSHYVPPTSKHGHSEHDHYYHHEQQQQHKNLNEQKHLESTTEEQAGTAIKHEETQNLDTTMMSVVTTSKVLVGQETTLKTFSAVISPTNKNETKQNAIIAQKEQHPVALTTNQKVDGSIKPIIEQQKVKEMEKQQQRENSKNLYFQDKETIMTAKIVPSADTTIAETTEKINVGHENEKDKEKQDLKQPQTTTAAETTQATKLVTTTEKSLRSTEKLYNLETATDSIEKEIAEPEIIQTQTQPQQQHKLPITNEKLTGHTTMKAEENKEHLQTTTGTTAKLNIAKKSQVITASATALAPTTQQQEQLPTTIKAETHSLQHMQLDQTDQEQLKEKEKQKEQDKKETIAKATEILVAAATAQEKLAKKEEEEEAKEKTIIYTTKPLSTTTETITSKTAVTTIKPITTILPQTEVKSTETSVSSTGAFITTAKATAAATTNIAKTTAVEENTSTRVTTSPTTRISSSTAADTGPSSSSSPPPAAITITNLTKTNAALAKATREARTETETLTSTSTSMPPETTRNFLKVTTEMPFKPNRRRTLTKPETVSYMKKILG